MGVQFLGSLPLNMDTISLADSGKPIIIEKPDADISSSMIDIIEKIQLLL